MVEVMEVKMDSILQQGEKVYFIQTELVLSLAEDNDIIDIVIMDKDNNKIKIGTSSESKNASSALINKEYYVNDTSFKEFEEFCNCVKQFVDGDNNIHVVSVGDFSPEKIDWKGTPRIDFSKEPIKVFCKRNVIRVSQLAIPFSILYYAFMVIMWLGTFDSVIEIIIGLAIGIIADIIIFGIVFSGNRKFIKSIKEEETKHNVVFKVENLRQMSWKVFLSDEWLIVIGDFALHRNSVKSIEKETASGLEDDGLQHVRVVTENDSILIKVDRQSDVNKLIKWCKRL